ncbi:MAG: TolC family protein, partial [Acidiferrobacterales bacterium]
MSGHPVRRKWYFFAVIATLSMAPAPHADAAPLTLSQAQAMLIQRSPTLAALRQEVIALRHQAIASAQLPDPEFSVMAQNLPTNSFSLRQQGMTMLSFGVSQSFPPFGKLGIEGRQGAMEAKALEYGRSARTAQLIYFLRRLWLQALYAGHALRILDAQRLLAEQSVETAMARYRAAGVPEADVLRARLVREGLANAQAQAQAEQSSLLARLARSLNLAEPPTLDPAWPQIPQPPRLSVLERHIAEQPMVKEAEARRRAARLGVQVARRDFYPRFTVSASYGQSFVPQTPNWVTVGVGVSVPLFTANRQDQRLDAAEARALKAGYRVQDRRLALERQARSAYARYVSLGNELQRTSHHLV